MKRLTRVSLVAALAAIPTLASAQAKTEPEPEYSISGNFGLGTDYRFRGISQTFGGSNAWAPTVQGGVDFSHKGGFYLGNWNSNVSGNQYPNGSSIEMDFYGGWKGSWEDIGFDIGTIYYYYPGAKFVGPVRNASGEETGGTYSQDIYNWEGYIGVSWKFLSLKYSYAFTDYFGLTNDVASNYANKAGTAYLGPKGGTSGTSYLAASGIYEVAPKWNVFGSVGYTWVPNYGTELNYFDYKFGVSYDLDGWVISLAGIGTNANEQWWYAVNGSSTTRDLGAFNAVLSVLKTF